MKRYLHKRNHLFLPVLLCLILYSFFFVMVLQKNGHDVTTFIHAGSKFVNGNQLSYPLKVLPDSYGYDGQFYYRLSQNPFTDQRIDSGIALDNPQYRQQRILYPFITWLFSFNPSFTPEIMIGINLLCLLVIAFYGGILAKKFNKHALWGISFVLWPGFLFTFSRNLTEIVAITFLLSGITHFFYKQYVLSGLLLSLAILGKETTLLVPISMCIAMITDYKKINKSVLFAGLLPVLVYGSWQLWLSQNWSDKWILGIQNNIGVPFLGIISFVRKLHFLPKTLQFGSVIELILVITFIVFTTISIRKTSIPKFLKISWLLYCMLVVSLTSTVWVEDIAFMRAISELFTVGTILLIYTNSNIFRYILPFGMIVWFYMCIDIIKFR